MSDLLRELATQLPLERALAVGLLVVARWTPVVILAPFLGGRALPTSARVAIALGLSLTVYPAAYSAAGPLPSGALALAFLTLREALVGTVIGVIVAIPFLALAAGGRLIDTARGARMAQILAAPTQERSSPTGALLLLFAVVIFLAIDGHHHIIQSVAESYRTLPLGGTLPASAPPDVARLVLHLGGELFVIAVGIAAPVLVAGVLLDLALGLAGRIAPELPLYFLGLPLKALSGIGLVLLTLTLSVVVFGLVYRLAIRSVQLALGG